MQQTLSLGLVQSLALASRARGGRALMVGGCVRDQFYGAEPKDLDVEVFGISEESIEGVLQSVAPHVIRVGRSFPVFKAWTEAMGTENAIDVALPRRERKTGDHHTDFEAVADPSMSFEDASSRRDFTINSIGFDPLTGEHLDPHGGIPDIKSGILRHVSPRFAEDPLRVLRGMQFAARFDLKPHPETIEFCKGLSADGLSGERLMEEFKKLVLKGKTPSRGLHFLTDTGWDRYFPEIAALKGVQQDPEWHPEGDAWIHTGLCLDAFARRRTGNDEKDLKVGLAVLCHDFGKASTTEFSNGRWRAHGHEEAGEKPAENFLRRMTDQTELIHGVVALVGNHMVPHNLFKEVENTGNPACMDSGVRRLAVKLGKESATLDELCLVCECDKAGRPPLPERSETITWLRDRAAAVQVLHERPKPILQGRDLIALGMTPGVGFKPILEDAFQRQLNGEFKTRAEAIAYVQSVIEHMPQQRPPLPAPAAVSPSVLPAQ